MTGYPEAQPVYQAAGWTALPLAAGTKWPPPTGFTGWDGRWPNEDDFAAWRRAYTDGNTAIRMPDGIVVDGDTFWVIGLDVDAYGTKTGAETLVEGERLWGPLPPTCCITSRAFRQ